MNHSFPQPNQNWEKNTMKIEWKHWWHENHLDKWKLRTFTFSEGFTTLNTFIRCRTDFICQILPVSNSKNSATCVNQTKAVPWKHYSSSPIQIQFSTPNNHRIPEQVNKIVEQHSLPMFHCIASAQYAHAIHSRDFQTHAFHCIWNGRGVARKALFAFQYFSLFRCGTKFCEKNKNLISFSVVLNPFPRRFEFHFT